MQRSVSLASVLVIAAACGTPEPAAPAQPKPLSPFSVDLATRIQPDLLACDLGVLGACNDLGAKLESATRLDEAVAAYDHGCSLGTRAKAAEADKCHQYTFGQSCHPAACSKACEKGDREAQKKVECKRSDPVICAERDRFCRYDTLENCLEIVGALQCARVAFVYYEQMPQAAGLPNGCPKEEWLTRALAYAEHACEIVEKASVSKKTGEWQTVCNQPALIRERATKCSLALPKNGDAGAVTAVRSSFRSYVDGIGKGVAFSPGEAPPANAPAAYVNPASKAQWTSANLALLAALFPMKVQAPTPPARIESVFGEAPTEADPAAKSAPK